MSHCVNFLVQQINQNLKNTVINKYCYFRDFVQAQALPFEIKELGNSSENYI